MNLRLFGYPVEIKDNEEAKKYIEAINETGADVDALNHLMSLRHAAVQVIRYVQSCRLQVARLVIDGNTIQAFTHDAFGPKHGAKETFSMEVPNGQESEASR